MIEEKNYLMLANFLKKYKINYVENRQRYLISDSYYWYRGNVPKFHFYKEVVGKKEEEFTRVTFNLPKKLCEDYASYIWNEKSHVTVNNSKINKKIQKVLVDNNFEEMFTEFIEKLSAYGGGAIITNIKEGKVVLDFINAENIIITHHKNNQVTGLITVDEFMNSGKHYLHLTRHQYEKNFYQIEHFLLEIDNEQTSKKSIDFDLIFSKKELEDFFYDVEEQKLYKTIETPIPFFQYFRNNIANNYDNKSPYGLSRLANLFEDFKQVDLNYDMIYRENLNGESTLFFDSSIAQEEVYEENGKMNYVQSFDYKNPNYKIVNEMKGLNNSGSPMFVYSPQLRNDTLHTSLTKLINSTAFKFGLGNQYYENKNTASTATEIVHTDSKLWRSIVKTQNGILIPLKKVIFSIISNMHKIDTDIFLDDADSVIEDIDVKFDDSIIIDDESLKDRALRLIELDILPKWKYLVDYENYTEEEAKKLVSEAEAIVDYTEEDEELDEEI